MTKLYIDNEPLSKLETIKETVLKRRKTSHKDVIRLQREKAKNVRMQARKRSAMFKGAAAFIIEQKKSRYDGKRVKNSQKKKAPLFLADSPKLGVVIRLGRLDGLCDRTKNLFAKLGLRTINQAVFVKVDREMMKKLAELKPFIAWGYPDTQLVNDMLTKRGCANIDNKAVRIVDNIMIETHLGKHNVICVADIVHELISVGPNFDAVNSFLWPFKLQGAPAGFLAKGNERKHASLEPASRDTHINELLKRMI